MEYHYYIDFFKRNCGSYIIRKECGAINLAEATEKAIGFIAEAESECGPLDKIYIINTFSWGNMIAWKKLAEGRIARLLIPKEARRVSLRYEWNHLKCEFAKTLNIYDGGTEVSEGVSISDPNIKFKVGELTYPSSYTDEFTKEPSPGLYCCYTREQAYLYQSDAFIP